MANSKISALPSATTPVAGTETLPIVQSGATKQVSVANLTAGRSVATGPLAVSGTGNVLLSLATTTSGSPIFWVAPAGGGNAITAWSTGQAMRFATADNSNLTNFVERVKIDGAGNTTFTGGNLVQGTAAKGVNFTANTPAAGMTSQLLNWYEQGTWTPTQGGGLTVVGAFTSTGTYTRIGNLVFVSGILNGATSIAYGGGTTIMTGGLPFTINAGFAGGGNAVNSALAAGCGLVGNRGTTDIYGDAAIATTTRIFFTLTYIV